MLKCCDGLWKFVYTQKKNNLKILKWATYSQIEDEYFLPNIHISFCLHKTSSLLICDENKDIYVANLMMQKRLDFLLGINICVLHTQ